MAWFHHRLCSVLPQFPDNTSLALFFFPVQFFIFFPLNITFPLHLSTDHAQPLIGTSVEGHGSRGWCVIRERQCFTGPALERMWLGLWPSEEKTFSKKRFVRNRWATIVPPPSCLICHNMLWHLLTSPVHVLRQVSSLCQTSGGVQAESWSQAGTMNIRYVLTKGIICKNVEGKLEQVSSGCKGTPAVTRKWAEGGHWSPAQLTTPAKSADVKASPRQLMAELISFSASKSHTRFTMRARSQSLSLSPASTFRAPFTGTWLRRTALQGGNTSLVEPQS